MYMNPHWDINTERERKKKEKTGEVGEGGHDILSHGAVLSYQVGLQKVQPCRQYCLDKH